MGPPAMLAGLDKTGFCVKLAAGDGGVVKKCWVRVVAIQPLLKSDLGDKLGVPQREVNPSLT